MKEAGIIINGHRLSNAESMTIRVALNSFINSLNDDGLGDDDHGRKMVELYTANAKNALSIVHKQ